MNRLESNIKILNIVKQLAYEFPDMRFNQLLMNIAIIQSRDQFYEESEQTLNRLRNYIKTKKEVYNQFKYIDIDQQIMPVSSSGLGYKILILGTQVQFLLRVLLQYDNK